jgi:mRNA interferase HigB
VKVIGGGIIERFKVKHPTCRTALDRVVTILRAAEWKNPTDAKKTLGVNIDFVGKQTVIDAGGNKARLITKITYSIKVILVTHVLDHKDYDENKWKE